MFLHTETLDRIQEQFEISAHTIEKLQQSERGEKWLAFIATHLNPQD